MSLYKETVGFYVPLVIIGSTIVIVLNQHFSGDKIEKNEMGGACNTYGAEERRIQGFGEET